MTWSGSDIVVIAARRPVAVALQAVLHDWMVQGLVTPCRIVDLDSLVAGREAVPAAVLGSDGVRTVALQQDLAHTRVGRIRLAVVGVVDEDVTSVDRAAAATVLDAIRQTVSSVPVVQLNLSAGSAGAEWSTRALTLFGWHNLAVSPEESASPSQGRPRSPVPWTIPLAAAAHRHRRLAHRSVAGQERAPFDDQQAPSGGLIVPIRAFSRSLSSGSVQDALASRLVSVHDRYPTPRVDASYALSIADEEGRPSGWPSNCSASTST
ncbi:hypothetical protein G7085_11665 [Tessaracoccus sp. HDW20]|uniref:hypothetical protein n=1 Tax=Tessaracoccus coleopterorum TaxID=2714950 RepID=UPI0018D2D9C0|nr:hypothetical protein [Tessaracoccus coleopterorum]NHB85045.1 hypothetical protein [Tessaracoccus coleopterorum]